MPISHRLTDARMLLAVFIATAVALRSENCRAAEPDPGPSRSDQVDFRRDIRPILSNKCIFCHGPDAHNRQVELRLDSEESVKLDRGGYRAVVPGDPAASELFSRVTNTDADVRMPPADSGKDLSPREISLLKRWIEQGAVWSEHWSYRPPERHPVPPVRNMEWPINDIDHFVLARLEAEDLPPSPDADRVTLIRRLYFDLIGLPPAPEEVDQFVDDQSDNAYERVVDRLLSSTHYGERMAMYWLDLVRYADTVGYHGDQDHAISPYRDWVIGAFNRDMPFDQFTQEQLAGDLLPASTIDQKIASGYNRLLQTSHEGGVQPKEYLAIYAADRVRNVSSVWMGATIGCCQCHDHKYDPFTSRDFYSLAAFFADLDEAQHFSVATNSLPTLRPPEIAVFTQDEQRHIAELEQSRTDLESRIQEGAGDAALVSELNGQIAAVEQQIDEIRNGARKTMISVAIEPRTMRVLPRGNWLDDTGEIVQPAVPEHLGRLDVSDRRATRLDLANWLADAQQGSGLLTARVFANRFWSLFFGIGLSKSLDDFGGQGEPPVNPELLDNLAVEFVQGQWSVKRIVKQIVMSRAYRQTSLASDRLKEIDPYNRLAARQSRFRLPAEMIRDNALAISGLLVLDSGGVSVRPYQPAGYYRHLNFPTRTYTADTDSRQWRRGVYVHWQRQFLHPMLKAFDAPSREECTAERPRSNTPLAALTLLNDPTYVEAARVFAARILRDGGEMTESRLDYAFRSCVSRKPDRFEADTMTALLAASRQEFADSPEAARSLIETGLAARHDELDSVECAAWTAVARVLLNMNETITRN